MVTELSFNARHVLSLALIRWLESTAFGELTVEELLQRTDAEVLDIIARS